MKINLRFSKILGVAGLAGMFLLGGCHHVPLTEDTTAGPGIGEREDPVVGQRFKPLNQLYTSIERVTFSDAGKDFDPFITPDGKKILFASTRHSPMSDIFFAEVGSKVVEVVTHTPNANEKQPQLSPDGKNICYVSDKEGQWNIYEISAIERGSREMEIVSNGRINEQPCYSPDGSKIAYVTWLPRQGEWHIAIMDRMTQQEKIYGPGLFPRWAPDGKSLVFQRARVRVPQWFSVWVLDLEREVVSEVVSSADWAAITPSFSPDGKQIIFAAVSKSVHSSGPMVADDIYTIWKNGTHLVRLTDDDAPDWSPIWTRDNNIFFISQRNGFQNIWRIHRKDLDPYHPDTIESGTMAGGSGSATLEEL